MIAVRAHFDGKVIVPDEPVNLPKGEALIVHVELAPPAPGSGEGSALAWLAENAVDDPSLPTDLSHQHDHYLYGSPKQES
jgi:hypothetical protein